MIERDWKESKGKTGRFGSGGEEGECNTSEFMHRVGKITLLKSYKVT